MDLAQILAMKTSDRQHQHLVEYVRKHADDADGHYYLGMSFIMNRFSPTLDLPATVMLLSGSLRPPGRDTIVERLERAETELKRALELHPKWTAASTGNIAFAKIAARRWGPAIRYIEELLERRDHDRSDAKVLKANLGVCYREMGEAEMALRIFEALDPEGLTFLHGHIALTHVMLGNIAAAIDSMRRQVTVSDDVVSRGLLEALEHEAAGDDAAARMAYQALADLCQFSPIHELTGINAARRADTIGPTES